MFRPLRAWTERCLARLRRRRSTGSRGERVAARHLRARGYRVLARNVRDRGGEIDLVAQAPDGRTIVIVEVKAGTGGPIRPEVHVNHTKRRKLVALASRFVRRHRLHDRRVRFDVIGVDFLDGQEPTVRHHVAVFDADGRVR